MLVYKQHREVSTNTITIFVGQGGGGGTGANITATVGVGGTLAFNIVSAVQVMLTQD